MRKQVLDECCGLPVEPAAISVLICKHVPWHDDAHGGGHVASVTGTCATTALFTSHCGSKSLQSARLLVVNRAEC